MSSCAPVTSLLQTIPGSQLLPPLKLRQEPSMLSDLFADPLRPPPLLDVLTALPRPSRPYRRKVNLGQKNASSGLRAAVCAVGHIRTLALPKMRELLANRLLRSIPGEGKADLYLVGHMGTFAGSDSARTGYREFTSQQMHTNESSEIMAVRAFAKEMGAPVMEMHQNGGCEDLEGAWAEFNTSGQCRGEGNFMQIMWLDHCIQHVLRSGQHYDVIIRTRPDVVLLDDFPWQELPVDDVGWMPKDAGGKADFFFSLPTVSVRTWWDTVVGWYRSGTNSLPDYTIFKDAPHHTIAFPAAIARSATNIECFRLVQNPYVHKCEDMRDSGLLRDEANSSV